MLNLTIGAVAWVLAGEKSFYTKLSKQNRKKEKTEEKQKLDVTLLLLYGVSGFCALSLQVLWTRTLILLLNNTTYAFSMILAVFLLGIGAGSILASRWLKKREDKSATFFAVCQIGVGAMALVSLVGMGMNDMLIAQIASMTDAEGFLSASMPGGEPMVSAILFSFLIVTPCTFLMGAGFPMIVEAISPNRERIGGAIGRLYAFNIAGCVTGSVLAAYALIPAVGVQNSILAIAWISAISGAFILLTKAGDKKVAPLSGAFVVLAALTLYISIGENIAYSLSAQKLDAGSEIEFYEEGNICDGSGLVAGDRPERWTSSDKKNMDRRRPDSRSLPRGVAIRKASGAYSTPFSQKPKKRSGDLLWHRLHGRRRIGSWPGERDGGRYFKRGFSRGSLFF